VDTSGDGRSKTMYQEFFKNLKAKLIKVGDAKDDTQFEYFKGCTQEEIDSLIKAQNVKRLPEVFLQYLKTMGKRGLSAVYTGSDWGISTMTYTKAWLFEDMDKDDEYFTWPEDAFIFFSHGGYEIRYFLTDNDNDNPPVYQYTEGIDDAIELAPSITEYFDALIERRII
jgi:hypothetical protein